MRAAILAVLVATGGCMVGPDYTPPETQTPPAWSGADGRGLIAAPPGAEALAAWWKTFDDPTLDELVHRAFAGNPSVQEAAARVAETRARRRIARAELLPTVEAAAGVTRTEQDEANTDDFEFNAFGSDRTLYEVGFDATWELDLFGGRRRGLEAAVAELEAGEANLGDVLVTLLGDLGIAYVDVREAQRRLAIAELNLATQEETFRIASWRSEAGLTTALDVEQARSSLEETRARIPALRATLAQARHRVAVLTGEPPGALTDLLAASAPIPAVPLEVAIGVPAGALLRRPDVRRAERELAAETARIGVAQAAAFPSISLVGSIGLEAFSASDLVASGAGSASGAARLLQTVLDFGRIRGNIEAQDAVRLQALARFESSVLTALEEVENALVAFSEEQARRESLAAAVAAADTAARLSRDQYASGLVDFDTVLVAERSRFNVEDQLAISQAEVTSQLIRLYKALGGGWAPQIEQADEDGPQPSGAAEDAS